MQLRLWGITDSISPRLKSVDERWDVGDEYEQLRFLLVVYKKYLRTWGTRQEYISQASDYRSGVEEVCVCVGEGG